MERKLIQRDTRYSKRYQDSCNKESHIHISESKLQAKQISHLRYIQVSGQITSAACCMYLSAKLDSKNSSKLIKTIFQKGGRVELTDSINILNPDLKKDQRC